MRPKGSGGAGASAALALLDDIPVSPASRRLASAPAALGTRPIVLSPRAARYGVLGSSESQWTYNALIVEVNFLDCPEVPLSEIAPKCILINFPNSTYYGLSEISGI